MFFADDMIIAGTAKQLQYQLNLVGKFAEQWKLEFSGAKSDVIPISRPVSQTKLWWLGKTPIRQHESKDIFMKETDGGKYLGILLKREENIYSNHNLDMIKKAYRASHTIINMLHDVLNPINLLQKLWNQYAIPNIIYGCDCTTITDQTINQIDKIMRTTIKSTLHLSRSAGNGIIEELIKIPKTQLVISQQRTNYLQYVQNLPDTRWVKKCLLEQMEWAIEDNLLQNTTAEPIFIPTRRGRQSTYYLKDTFKHLQRGQFSFQTHGTKIENKMHVKKLATTQIESYFEEHRSTTKYMEQLKFNHAKNFNIYTQLWWLRMKTSSLHLNSKIHTNNKLCPFCDVEETDLHFLWQCRELNKTTTLLLPYNQPDLQAWTQFWTKTERLPGERKLFNDYVKTRWTARSKAKKKIQLNIDDNRMIT
jgi:hypothetical protein